jgi:hypothetical protein
MMLRWSVLAAAGVVPAACSGDEVGTSPGSAGVSGEPGASGSPGHGGEAGGGADHGGDAGAGAQPHGPFSCTNPHQEVTGLVACDEGYRHRPKPVTCELAGGGMPGVGSGGEGGAMPLADGTVECIGNHEACDRFERGFCAVDDLGAAGATGVCESGCVSDEDCATDELCLCRDASPTGGQCVAADCRTDADCNGYPCAPYSHGCGGGYACKTPEDACVTDADCEPGDGCFPQGAFDVERGPWQCQGRSVCGRPFLVQHEARVARLVVGEGWLTADSDAPNLRGLAPGERERCAAVWSNMALLEHASIAAFARFNLQLLALGAPAELIVESTCAIADETAHARLCFDLASAYVGQKLGPGPLDIAGSLEAVSLGEVVDLVLIEGCFGETGAALDALEAATSESDPVLQSAYSRIARDEQRHAELAFRFLRWALERDFALVSERIELACEAPALRAHAAREVAVPCLRALLDAVNGAAPRGHAPSVVDGRPMSRS